MSRRILRISTSEFPCNLQTLNNAFLPQQRTPLAIGRLNCVGPVRVTKSLGKAYMLKNSIFVSEASWYLKFSRGEWRRWAAHCEHGIARP